MTILSSNCSIHSSTQRFVSDRRGLSLIYGVMRIVISPWDALCVSVPSLGLGRRRGVGHAASGTLALPASCSCCPSRRRDRGLGAVIEPRCCVRSTDGRRSTKIADHVRPAYYPRRRHEVPCSRYATHRRIDHDRRAASRSPAALSDLQTCSSSRWADRRSRPVWFIYRTKFGVILRATSPDRRMAQRSGSCQPCLRASLRHRCFMAGLGRRSWCRRRPPCSAGH